MEDAEGFLRQRLEAMQELLDLYNEQASVATDAYDESSQYAEELSAAIVAARGRGLLARSDAGISLETFTAIARELAALPEIGGTIRRSYYELGRPALTMFSFIVRLIGSAVLVGALVLLWLRLPGWLLLAFVGGDGREGSDREVAGEASLAELRDRRHAEMVTPVARAATLAAVAAIGLAVWGLPQEWISATLAVLGTWAAYFALVAIMRQILAPHHEQLRAVRIDTDAAAALYRLLRALALWSAILLPVIWALSALNYERQDILVLLSVVHVVAFAIIAGWMIYGAGGPSEFMDAAEGHASRPLRHATTAAVPVILGVAAAVALLKALGYVNLGEYLSRILYLDVPLVLLALIADWQVRAHLPRDSAWRTWLRVAVWTALGIAQIWVLQLRWHHGLAVLDFLKRPLFTVAETQVSAFSIFRAIVVILIAWALAKAFATGSRRRSGSGRA